MNTEEKISQSQQKPGFFERLGSFFKRKWKKWAVRLLGWFSEADGKPGITEGDFDTVLALVRQAEEDPSLPDGQSKKEWVMEQIKDLLRITAPYLIDALIGLAVGYLAKKGIVNLSQVK